MTTTARQMLCQDHRTRGRSGRVDHQPVPSDPRAFLFEARPEAEFDRYYCGCFGWD